MRLHIIIFLLFTVICCDSFSREEPILDYITLRKDTQYPSGIIPADAREVIPEVLSKTLFEDMHKYDRWVFAKSYSQDPETASKIVSAQIALYCWQQSTEEDHLGSQEFIASSLFELWRHDDSIKLCWYDKEKGKVDEAYVGLLCKAYTFQYNKSPDEIEKWINNVVSKISNRKVWAVISVKKILDKKKLKTVDYGSLAEITRNMFIFKTRDLENFKKWWEKNKDNSRTEWAKSLIERSLTILENPKGKGRRKIEAANEQLLHLLPHEVYKNSLALVGTSKIKSKDDYNSIVRKLKKWWSANKKTYNVPLSSMFAY